METKIVVLSQIIIASIGFWITISSTKKNFQNELSKQKNNVLLEQMTTVPYDILALYDKMTKVKNEEQQNDLTKELMALFSKIYAYGSSDAIAIMSVMQSENYANAAHTEETDKFRLTTFYVLLASQIKYDITGVAISPIRWFQMRITDFEENKKKFLTKNNELVKELGLIDAFLMK